MVRTRTFSKTRRRLAAGTVLALLGTATFGATAASPASAALPQCFMNSLPTVQWAQCEINGLKPGPLPQCFMNSLPTPQWVECELNGILP
jgi:hypothetical protein